MKKKKLSKEKKAIIAFWPLFLVSSLVALADIHAGFDGYSSAAMFLPIGLFIFETVYYKVFKTGAYIRTVNWWRNSLRRLVFAWVCFIVSLLSLLVLNTVFAAVDGGFSSVPAAAAETLLEIRWLGNYLFVSLPVALLDWEVVHRPGIIIEMDDGKEYKALEAYYAEEPFFLLSETGNPLRIAFYKQLDDETMELATEAEARELFEVAKSTIYRHIMKRIKSIELGERLIFSNYPRVKDDGTGA